MSLNHKLIGLLGSALLMAACSDDTTATSSESESSSESSASDSDMSGSESASDSAGDGDGDGDGDTAGDGDGDTAGDGDGDTTGDGDGDTTGDGDGDTTGDGDGDTTGDGDGDTTGDGDGDTTTGDGDGDEPDCSAQQASGMGPCDQFFGWAWNGAACVAVNGCNCVGPDCDVLPLELDECEAAYAECDGQPVPGCENLDLQQCQAAQECMPLNGFPLEENPNEQQCLGDNTFVACTDAGFCGGALTWACDGQGNSVWFTSTCIPEGWDPCQGPQDLPECP